MGWKTRKRGSRKQRGTKFKTRKPKKKKHSFPKNPEKGQRKTITVRGRKVTFEATGEKGFGAWKIVSSEKT